MNYNKLREQINESGEELKMYIIILTQYIFNKEKEVEELNEEVKTLRRKLEIIAEFAGE